MKRLKRITASNDTNFSTDVRFTPDEVRQLLLQIEQLQNCDIALEQSADGLTEFIIGNSVYCISDENKRDTFMS